jgi:aspartyl protease family protein
VEIALQRRHGGTFTLLATLNRSETVPFMVDTGSSDVAIPRDVADQLIANGSLSNSDFVRVQGYATANGHIREPVYRLHSISIGPVEIHDVECSIAKPGTMPLLGQSFLKRFHAVTLDQERSVLVLER